MVRTIRTSIVTVQPLHRKFTILPEELIDKITKKKAHYEIIAE